MPFKRSGPATSPREIDRWDGGVGWIAHPGETMQRASHALAVDGDVWVVDPVDAEGIDDRIAEFGSVAGVVVLFNHHERDAAAIAARHDVPVYVPAWLDGVARDLGGPVERFEGHLTGDRYRVIRVGDTVGWREAALYDEPTRTLVVAESLGNAAYFRAGDERLGVHMMRRMIPTRRPFRGLHPDRILLGHGPGVMANARGALDDALANARRRLPAAGIEAAKAVLSG